MLKIIKIKVFLNEQWTDIDIGSGYSLKWKSHEEISLSLKKSLGENVKFMYIVKEIDE